MRARWEQDTWHVYVHCSDALVDHRPWTCVTVLVRGSVAWPVSDMVTLAADDDCQQRSVRFPLGSTLGLHSSKRVNDLGKLFFDDGVELSLRLMVSKAL